MFWHDKHQKYLAELFIIIFGILIALWAESKVQEHPLNKSENKKLEALKRDLNTMKKDTLSYYLNKIWFSKVKNESISHNKILNL